MRSAILNYWEFLIKTPNLIDENVPKHEVIAHMSKVSQYIYELTLIDDILCKCTETWYRKADIMTNIDEMRKHFKNGNNTTCSVKLRTFQLRLLHNKIFCNDILVHWRKKNSNKCDFCDYKQDIKHLLYDCTEISKIWGRFGAMFLDKNHQKISFENILFNNIIDKPKYHIINLLMLITKQIIFRGKCSGELPTYRQFVHEYYRYYKIECYNAVKDNLDIEKIKKKWSPVITGICEY